MNDSLDRFRTVAFEMSLIRENIAIRDGALDITRWIAVVPEVYRRSVLRLVAAAFDVVRGTKADRVNSTFEFANELYRLIWRDLKPIDPGDVDRLRIMLVEELVAKVIAGEATITDVVTGMDESKLLTRITISDVDHGDDKRWSTHEFTERMATFWGERLERLRKES